MVWGQKQPMIRETVVDKKALPVPAETSIYKEWIEATTICENDKLYLVKEKMKNG